MAKRLKPPNFTIVNSCKTKSSLRCSHLIENLVVVFLHKALVSLETRRQFALITVISLSVPKKASQFPPRSRYLLKANLLLLENFVWSC